MPRATHTAQIAFISAVSAAFVAALANAETTVVYLLGAAVGIITITGLKAALSDPQLPPDLEERMENLLAMLAA